MVTFMEQIAVKYLFQRQWSHWEIHIKICAGALSFLGAFLFSDVMIHLF